MHGRNREKAESTMNTIKKETNSENLNYVYADLESFAQIKEMVRYLYDNFNKLDVLINNAGAIHSERKISPEGIEETFAINYVAPFLLTNLLLDLLKKANSSRIINVVSRVHSNQVNFKDLQLEKGYSPVKAYANSKTALILFTYFLAVKLKGKNITVNCLHPGVIDTKLLRAAYGTDGAPLTEGANRLVFAATAPELENVSGKYLVHNRSESSKEITYDREVQKTLWRKTEQITGMTFE